MNALLNQDIGYELVRKDGRIYFGDIAKKLELQPETIRRIKLRNPVLWNQGYLPTVSISQLSEAITADVREDVDYWMKAVSLDDVKVLIPDFDGGNEDTWGVFLEDASSKISHMTFFNTNNFLFTSTVYLECEYHSGGCAPASCDGECRLIRGDDSKYGGEFYICRCEK